MEFATYIFAVVGVLALIGLLAAFVAAVWTHDTQISRLFKHLKDIEHFYDSRMDRMYDKTLDIEKRVDEIEEILTEGILNQIASIGPKSGSKRK